MGRMRGVTVGMVLAVLVAVGEAPAQVLLSVEQRRAEEVAEQRINDLRARASCHDQHAAARAVTWAAHEVHSHRPDAKRERDAQLLEADQQLRQCLERLQAGVLRETCRAVARTEAQRARCD